MSVGVGLHPRRGPRLAGQELTVLCFIIIFSCFGGDSIVWALGRWGMCARKPWALLAMTLTGVEEYMTLIGKPLFPFPV